MKRVYFPIIGIVAAFFVMTIGGVDNVARGQTSLPAPTSVTTDNGSNAGEADLSWPGVAGATYYRIGWMADEDYQRALDEPNGEWLKEFRYSNVISRGQSSHTVTRLTPGIKYWFTVGSHNAFYGGPAWSAWAELTLDGDGPICPGTGTQTGTCPHIESSQFRMSETKFEAIDAGKNHACGIKLDDTVECWGDNTEGQTDAPEGEFMSISAGGVASCGINFDDNLECWGHPRLTRTPDGEFTDVSVGDEHACAVTVTTKDSNEFDVNQVVCWGLPNNDGRTVHQYSGDRRERMVWTSVSAGGDYNCALPYDRGASFNPNFIPCWGNTPASIHFDSARGITAVSTGGAHVCGLYENADIACHGNDVHGQVSRRPNAQVEGDPASFYTYSAVSAGGRHSCGLRTTGNIRCWGDDLRGQATPPGNNDELQSDLQGVGDFKAITAGDSHTCGVRDDGTVVCWGYNVHG